jgi:GT2 family glycosyltransferase
VPAASVDILTITHDRPRYTRLALGRLLSTCDERARVWIWHNGDDAETLEVVRSFLEHPQVVRFHHSSANVGVAEPTDWLWSNAEADLVGKVDDDCLVPDDWLERLRAAHAELPEIGALACWPFREEDFFPNLARPKINTHGRFQVLRNCWVQGSGYLLKRSCIEEEGPLGGRTFRVYCTRLALRGWAHGWLFPLVYMDHMDDPRSPHAALERRGAAPGGRSLTARTFDVATPAERVKQIRSVAWWVQTASLDPRAHVGWRARLRWAKTIARNAARGRRLRTGRF